jgi:ABC-type antimicrobial peptide transport system permease subunit
VKDIDPNQPISRVITMTDVVAESLAERRLVAVLVAGFAMVALVLAAIGIYGTAASAVAERTREIGIRVALGAEPRRLVRLILTRPVRLVSFGLLAGLCGAIGLAGLIRGLLYGVKPADPATLGAVAVVVVVVAMVAAWIPARWAIRADPAGVLKAD